MLPLIELQTDAQACTKYLSENTHQGRYSAVIFIWINCILSLKNNPQITNLLPHVFLPLTVVLLLLYSMSQLQVIRAGLFISGQGK